MKPEEMTAEELWAAWERSNGIEEWDRLAAELRARLRGYEAMKKQAEWLSVFDDNGEGHEVQAVQSAGKSVLAEMERARSYPQSARAGR